MGEYIFNKQLQIRSQKVGVRVERGTKVILSVTPDNTIENGLKVEALALALYEIYQTALERLTINTQGVTYLVAENFAYEIYQERGAYKFLFVVPQQFKSMLLNKIENTWSKATISRIIDFNYRFDLENTSYTTLQEKERYFKSLKCDLRGCDPLPSVLGVNNSLEDGDAVLLQYIFEPISNIWRDKALRDYEDYRKGIDKSKSPGVIAAIAKIAFKIIDEGFKIFDMLFSIKATDPGAAARLQLPDPSNATIQKIKYDAFKTAIRIVCRSEDPKRREHIIKSMAIALKDLSGDNELISTGIKSAAKTHFNFFKPGEAFIRKVLERRGDLFNDNILSVREAAQILQQPTKPLQDEYNINSIDTREINIPAELRGAGVPIGSAIIKGSGIFATWPSNYDLFSLPKIIVGPMGSGKTEYITRFILDCHQRRQGVVLFDYIKNNELTEKIRTKAKDPARVLVLDMADLDNPIRLSFDEIKAGEDPRGRLKAANLQAEMITYLLDSIREETTPKLSGRMLRYLYAAAMLVYIHKDKGLEDLQGVLYNHRTRAQYIEQGISCGVYNKNSMEVLDLQSLDEIDAKGKVKGTSESKIDGILDRLNILSRNIYLRSMLTGSVRVDLVELMNKKFTVIIKIPEALFPGIQVKDTLVTFFTAKLRLATLIRGAAAAKPDLCHVIYDEVHKIPTAAEFIARYIDEVRKYGLNNIFTLHYFKQFNKLLEPIRAAGVSYMILSGTEKESIKEIEEDLQPFSIAEALKIKQWHSLNIIKTSSGKAVFMSELPKPQ